MNGNERLSKIMYLIFKRDLLSFLSIGSYKIDADLKETINRKLFAEFQIAIHTTILSLFRYLLINSSAKQKKVQN